jgi:sigma-B regulation protein RsbU (phosphoserine phosphatase)
VSENRAGIFIADVMGHGARSALVTAILRALLQNLARGNAEPAAFLTALNRHFYEIVRTSKETIFVSAFYLIIDTQTAVATYASAGHPAPFFADGTTGEIAPLLPGLKANPALGLFAACDYSQWSRPVRPGDLFLLFTDGVHEAYAPSGEEFGLARLREVIAANVGARADQLTGAVVAALNEFIQPNAPADDICLVAVRIAHPSVAPSALPRELPLGATGAA